MGKDIIKALSYSRVVVGFVKVLKKVPSSAFYFQAKPGSKIKNTYQAWSSVFLKKSLPNSHFRRF